MKKNEMKWNFTVPKYLQFIGNKKISHVSRVCLANAIQT